MARLVVITKDLAVAPHELNEKWITIGRAEENVFQIDEPTVSNKHCEARLTGGELIVRDMQSTNGTFVDGEKITAGTLKPGQTLRLGMVELRLEVPALAARPGSGTTKMPTSEPSKPAPVASIAPKTSLPELPRPSPVPKPVSPPVAPAAPDKKFQVLFVDDSMAFLETFTDLCSVLSERIWEIHTAPTADLALTLLQKIPIDLAVLDIGMPMLDGLQLMGIVRRRYPAIKIAVMTGNGNEARRADALANGAALFIEKPVTPDGVKTVFNMLNDLVSWKHRDGFSGALQQVGLQEVIQMECVARHSSILEIRNQQMRGQIFIETGAIRHAVAGPLVGEAAFHQLLSMTGGEFKLKPFQAPPQHTLHGGWEFLLLEAARRNDEDTGLLSKKMAEAAAAGHSPPDDSKKSFRDAPQNPA